jgi:DNA-directed RNA polymerase subunit RPC12/RpoP
VMPAETIYRCSKCRQEICVLSDPDLVDKIQEHKRTCRRKEAHAQ